MLKICRGLFLSFLRHLCPICRVHHIHHSYGWVLAPYLPWTVGWFHWMGWHVVRRREMHNCTWSGVY